MKIIFVTPFIPYPLDFGGVIKTASTLKQLREDGNEITIFSYSKNKNIKKTSNQLNEMGLNVGDIIYNHKIKTVDIKTSRRIVIKSLFSTLPYTAYKFSSKKMVESLREYIKTNDYDIFWVDHFQCAHLMPEGINKTKVLETHNVESDLFKEMFLLEKNLSYKLFAFVEWIKYLRYDKKFYKKFDQIIAISNINKDKIQKISGVKNIKVSKTVVKPTLTKKVVKKPYDLFFVGSLYWYPNRDGVDWFLKEVFPAVLEQIPEIKLYIIGDYSKEFKFPKIKGVKFLGYQKNIAKYFQESQALIVPIRYGSGIRIKVLEAISYNLPVISTSKGVEGIDNLPSNVIQANTKKDFIEAVKKLLDYKVPKNQYNS